MKFAEWTSFGPGRFVARCETAAEFLNPPVRLSNCREAEYIGEADWRGTGTYAEAEQLIRTGWPDGARQAAAMAAKLDGVLASAAHRETWETAWDVAGDEADVARVSPLLEKMGETIYHCGPLGMGIRAKIVNNYHTTVLNVLTAETLTLAEAFGLSLEKATDVMRGTPAGRSSP